MYLGFLEKGVLPEQVRAMPAYDVYMLMYAKLAKYINDWKKKQPKSQAKSAEELNALLKPGK